MLKTLATLTAFILVPVSAQDSYTWSDPIEYELEMVADANQQRFKRTFRPSPKALAYTFIYNIPTNLGKESSQYIIGDPQFSIKHPGASSKWQSALNPYQDEKTGLLLNYAKGDQITLRLPNNKLVRKKKSFVYDPKLKPISKNPFLATKLNLGVRDKVFNENIFKVDMSVMDELNKNGMPKDAFVASNLLPPPDLVKKMLGSKKDIQKRSIGSNIELIFKGIKKQFKVLRSDKVYSKDLSYAYDKKVIGDTRINTLIKAFTSELGIPMRVQVGYVMTLKSATTIQTAEVRSWQEIFIPNMGWVPMDYFLYHEKANLKERFVGNLSSSDAIRIKLGAKHIFSFGLTHIDHHVKKDEKGKVIETIPFFTNDGGVPKIISHKLRKL